MVAICDDCRCWVGRAYVAEQCGDCLVCDGCYVFRVEFERDGRCGIVDLGELGEIEVADREGGRTRSARSSPGAHRLSRPVVPFTALKMTQ